MSVRGEETRPKRYFLSGVWLFLSLSWSFSWINERGEKRRHPKTRKREGEMPPPERQDNQLKVTVWRLRFSSSCLERILDNVKAFYFAQKGMHRERRLITPTLSNEYHKSSKRKKGMMMRGDEISIVRPISLKSHLISSRIIPISRGDKERWDEMREKRVGGESCFTSHLFM